MRMKRVYAAVAGALVAGVILGTASSGMAATAPEAGGPATSSVTAACGNLGLRLGTAVRDGGGRLIDVVATLTGKSAADITAERQAGKTFSDIAAESGVSTDTVVAEALAVRRALLDAKVQDGTITQAQADAAVASMETRLNERVQTMNTDCGAGEGCGMGGSGRGTGGGMGGGRGAGAGRGAGCTATAQ